MTVSAIADGSLNPCKRGVTSRRHCWQSLQDSTAIRSITRPPSSWKRATRTCSKLFISWSHLATDSIFFAICYEKPTNSNDSRWKCEFEAVQKSANLVDLENATKRIFVWHWYEYLLLREAYLWMIMFFYISRISKFVGVSDDFRD